MMMKASVNMKNTVNQHSKVRKIILLGRTKAYLSVASLYRMVLCFVIVFTIHSQLLKRF